MRILSYTQILTAVDQDRVRIAGVVYTLSGDLKDYVSANLPVANAKVFGDQRILIILPGRTDIVMFQPGGPPDPG